MSAAHALNAVAWFANAIVWAGYAHVMSMAVASVVAMLAAGYMAYRGDV